MNAIVDYVGRDLEALQAGGADAVMFGNEGDRPYLLDASPESLAAMAAVVGAVKGSLRVPFGVNYLWDPVATVALAVATGAAFAREIFTGVYDSDMGLWRPDAARAVRMRHDLGRRRSQAALQRERRVRRAARASRHRVPGRERGVLFPRRRGARFRPDDRAGDRPVRSRAGQASGGGHAGSREHRLHRGQHRRNPRGRGRLHRRHSFQSRWRHLEPGRAIAGRALHGKSRGGTPGMRLLLGLDIGTTSTIGILIDPEGGTLATASRPQRARLPAPELGGGRPVPVVVQRLRQSSPSCSRVPAFALRTSPRWA